MTDASVLTVVQARTGSSRLPGKVLLRAAGKSLLIHQVERIRRARLVGTVLVATTVLAEDDEIVRLCEGLVPCFRGHPTDLLDRHYWAAHGMGSRHVVKIPSDCPLIDPNVIDQVLTFYLAAPGRFDYVSNLHPQSFPDGNDVEIFSFEALQRAWLEARADFEREHTTPYFWDSRGRFRVGNVLWETGLDYSRSHRWTVDYPEDYELVREVFGELYPRNPAVGLGDILAFLAARPALAEHNARHRGVNWYRHHLSRLKDVIAAETPPSAATGSSR